MTPSIVDAFLSRPAVVQFDDKDVMLSRPTVAHFIAAQDAESRGEFMPAWYVWQHTLDENGRQAFKSIEYVKEICNAPLVMRLARLIEPLYLEGLDLPAPHAKS